MNKQIDDGGPVYPVTAQEVRDPDYGLVKTLPSSGISRRDALADAILCVLIIRGYPVSSETNFRSYTIADNQIAEGRK